jgi:adenosylcobinamide-GDP ribazoletransferase
MGGITTDIRTGLAFCTRLPLSAPPDADLAQASWTFPLIGALIGALGALAYWLAAGFGMNAFVASVLALAATALITGALHEDGLADTADGLGGGATKELKLEIMRDSRAGTYGVIALIVTFLLKAGVLTNLTETPLVAFALIAAHSGARAILPAFMRAVPRAREDGLAATAGEPPSGSAAIAAVLGFVALLFCLGLGAALVAALAVAAASFLLARLAMQQIGGQTGDVLGAVEQVGEIAILLTASVFL